MATDHPEYGRTLGLGSTNMYNRRLFVRATVHYWKLHLAAIMLAALLSLVAWNILAPVFKAEVTVVIPERSGVSGTIPSILASSGVVSSISLPDTGGRSAEIVATLRSIEFLKRFLRRNGVANVLGVRVFGSAEYVEEDDERSAQEMAEFFREKVMSIKEDRRTGLVMISIRWRDAAKAAEWANRIVQELNEYMRERDILRAEHVIAAIQSRIADVRTVELKVTLYRLLEEQYREAAIARTRPDYALRIVDAATPPIEPITPTLWVAITGGIALGVAGSFFFALRREAGAKTDCFGRD